MTKVDTELFDLCRKVYEVTGWNMPKSSRNRWLLDRGSYISQVQIKPKAPAEYKVAPLYTSDYLLEKLAVYFEITDNGHIESEEVILISREASTPDGDATWMAMKHPNNKTIKAYSTSPLKALLKLCIKLKKEGVI